MKYCGTHIIAELNFKDDQKSYLYDHDQILDDLKEACLAAGAQILSSESHNFGDGFGVTGVVILAESHASFHTWPEHNYMALDIFMCGNCDPSKALAAFCRFAVPLYVETKSLQRGKIE